MMASFSVEESNKNDSEILSKTEDGDILSVKIRQRAGKRASATKTINQIKQTPPTSVTDIKFYISKLTSINNLLSSQNDEIESLMFSKNMFKSNSFYVKHSELCESYTDSITLLILSLTESLSKIEKSNAVPSPVVPNIHATPGSGTKLKLPEIQLPKFDGQPESYERFITSFEGIISKFNLTPFEKYSYLLQQLSGSARQIVESVHSGDLNYDDARKLLEDAFSSKVLQQYSVINKLLNLKLNDMKNAYKWIGEARILADQVERLKIDGDIFVQYFLWNGLADKFKFQYTNIINCARPSLSNILEYSFEVFNRLKDVKSNPSSYFDESPNPGSKIESKSFALATNVICEPTSSQQPDSACQSVSFRSNANHKSSVNNFPDKRASYNECGLCKNTQKTYFDHRVVHCPVYKTPYDKLSVIKKFKGCIKCGLLNHEVQNCNYKFSGKCRKCYKYHAYFLCIVEPENNFNNSSNNNSSNSSNNKSNKKGKHHKVSTNLIQFDVMHSTSSASNNLIPTFTAKFQNVKGSFRAMYDTASQTSFISEAACDKLKPEIVNPNLKIKITGFNESKTYETKVVQLNLNLNGKVRSFKAVVVPSINTHVSADLRLIVRKFSEAKVELADKFLGGGDDGTIDILLGVDGAHVIPVHSCSFGSPDSLSSSYHTCLGVMLAGSVENLKSNLDYLHLLKTYNDKIKKLA